MIFTCRAAGRESTIPAALPEFAAETFARELRVEAGVQLLVKVEDELGQQTAWMVHAIPTVHYEARTLDGRVPTKRDQLARRRSMR